jgi:hypothetical protein
MGETNTTLPPWLPWATTAVLAALLACVGEVLMMERARNQLLRDEGTLAATLLQAADNQLEAERIVGRREVGTLRSAYGVAFLLEPKGGACGVVVWNPVAQRGLLTLEGLPAKSPDGDFQLWLVESVTFDKTHPSSCAVFSPPLPGEEARVPVNVATTFTTGRKFVLVYGRKGGFGTLPDALASGSIVLATPPR